VAVSFGVFVTCEIPHREFREACHILVCRQANRVAARRRINATRLS